jgi:hypothetical protein
MLTLYLLIEHASEHFKNFGKDCDATLDELEVEFRPLLLKRREKILFKFLF